MRSTKQTTKKKVNREAPSSTTIKSVILDVKKWFGICLTEAQLKSFFIKHPEMIEECGPGGLDTFAREMFISELCSDLKIEPWPCNGDSEETKQKFYPQLVKACKKAKYKLLHWHG